MKQSSASAVLWLVAAALWLQISLPAIGATDASRGRTADGGQRVTVVFRYDDYSNRSRTDIERRIIATFRKNRLPITFGVIPFSSSNREYGDAPGLLTPLSEAKAAILREGASDGTVEIAQHGFTHREKTVFSDGEVVPTGAKTEFVGLGYVDQLEQITRGKQYLEKVVRRPVATFIPPWNSYDINTVRVLEKLRFKYLSTGLQEAGPPTSLKIMPYVAGIDELESCIAKARRIADPAPMVVCLFHTYDFNGVKKNGGKMGYQDFDKMVGRVASDKSLRVLSIAQAGEQVDDTSYGRYVELRSLWNAPPATLIPGWFRDAPAGVYLSHDGIMAAKRHMWRVVVAYAAFVFLPAFLAGGTVFRLSRRLKVRSDMGITFFVGVLAAVIGVHHRAFSDIGYQMLACIMGSAGLVVGWCLSLLRSGGRTPKVALG